MVALRCTQKLLARVGPPSPVTEPTTTRLGDWYAQPLAIGHRRLILLISEHSRLPVIMPARDSRQLTRNFPLALSHVLLELDIPWRAVEREVAETREALIAKTESRSLLGTLTDFSHLLQWLLPERPGLDLVQAAVELSHTPVQPLGRLGFPDKVTRELLA
jgi:hypothetical protein